MEIVIKRKSIIHGIYPEHPHEKSYAALVLLNRNLEKAEIDSHIIDLDLNIEAGNVGKWEIQVAFNTRFLRKQQELHGALTCVYCGKTNLVIDSPIKNILATADHVIPKSKGGHPFDERNLVVACSPCNGRKGDKEGYLKNGKYTF
jgi:5-methylcytosine-specific restriction endonuclease McrA